MLVRVTKQITKTITSKEVFYVESGSTEEAENFVSTNLDVAGHYTEEESQPKEVVYGLVADFTGYAKILLKRGTEDQHIVYSLTLNKKDIKTAILEQVADIVDVWFRDDSFIETNHETGYKGYEVHVLEQPTLSDWDIKVKQCRELFASISKKNKDEEKETEAKDPAIYDEKYFQFVDWLDKNG
ncbi:hypothetical protein [Ralstonia mannitolilytica]|uniref:hypothetical protein n=1 Tax=Ralstonia mannitolilytica TaxID=105219 RepID=UPI001C95F121|nr:hypothetical protein [Ralstonia mannitolilytica]MBY4717565.1 hypothetical protein [Ralstonia mannitolilytica]